MRLLNPKVCVICGRWKARGNLFCDRCLKRAESRLLQALVVFIPVAAGLVTLLAWLMWRET